MSSELWVESLKERVESQKCKFRSTSYEFKSKSYEFKFTSYKFKSTSYEFKSTSYEFRSTSYEFIFTSYEFKSTSSRIVRSMKTEINSLQVFTRSQIIRSGVINFTRLARLVSRFACNTRVIVDASSSPPVSRIKIAVTKT